MEYAAVVNIYHSLENLKNFSLDTLVLLTYIRGRVDKNLCSKRSLMF